MSDLPWVAGVILAAGFSRRLGRPKQTLILNGETLIERAVRIAHEADLSPVIVVVNEQADFGNRLQQEGCVVVVNRQAGEGMASSIRLGVDEARARQAAGVVVMTCDQVAVRPEHLRSLYEQSTRLTGSTYGGKAGVPAYFPAASFGELSQLRGDVGARDLLRSAHWIVAEELELDVDTVADAERARCSTEQV